MRRSPSSVSWGAFLSHRASVIWWLFLGLAAVGITGFSMERWAGERIRLTGPPSEEPTSEADAVLSWTADPSASEYVVFISSRPIAERTAADLWNDPEVTKTTVTGTSLRLQQAVRGAMGRADYSWAVAGRDRRTGTLSLSETASFPVDKRFDVSSGLPHPIEESARGTFMPAAYGDAHSILIGQAYRFDPLRGEPAVPGLMSAAAVGPHETASYLVQLEGPVESGQREALVSAGARVFAYIPNYTFLVRMTPTQQAAVASLSFVRWVGPYQPAYKVSPLPQMSAPGVRSLSVLLFPDADLEASRTRLEALGGRTEEATDSGRNKIIRTSIDLGMLAPLATLSEVAWVEPYIQPEVQNNQAQWVLQTNASEDRRIWNMGIQGQGQVVHTSDSGIRPDHNQFRDNSVSITTWGEYPTHRKIIAYLPAAVGVLFGDAAGASYHGTHTAGSFMGDDSPFAADNRDGMALKAKIFFHDAGAATNSIIAPGDLNILFQPAYDGNAGGAARVSSNSWGGNAAGAYTIHSMTVDQFLWDHRDMYISFSNGNAGPQPATVGSPASNKNGTGSGATANGAAANAMMPLSSQGPCADGRLKPTLLSPGLQTSSANGANTSGYAALTGTSMSSPNGAGTTVLMRQYLMEGWYPTGVKTPAHGFVPSGALLKALGIASTDDDMPGLPIPNNVAGWGRINADNVLYFAGDAQRLAIVDQHEGLGTGDFVEYKLQVTDPLVPLRIALVWYDWEGNPAAARQLVNDLDLTVTDPLAVQYLGNFFAGGESQPSGLRDTLNVEECVRRNVPVTGVWTIRVSATNVPVGPQPFALVVSGSVGGGAGIVQIDKSTYGGSDVIEIRVEDANAPSTISVEVASDTETNPESVSMPRVGGVYTATISTTTDGTSPVDGMLSVSHGDQIVVSYDDAVPAATLSVTAVADLEGPVISNVQSADAGAAQRVSWDTDLSASTRVYYGTTPALGQTTAPDPNLVTNHETLISGLIPETIYWFDVESTDQVGNTTYDDNGGYHYTFSTGRQGDILLVIGDASFSGTGEYVSTMRARGWDPSILSGGTITDPPLGSLEAGLRSYTAVLWQTGQEQYPPFPDAAQDTLTQYVNGGGRLSIWSHDVAWSFSDPASGYYTLAREQWIANTLHINWLEDPLTWPALLGIAGDPISDAYQTGALYTPIREGGAGDAIELVPGTGTGAYVWQNTDPTIDNIAVRWESNTPNGTAGSAVWGGTRSRVVTNCWEFVQLNEDSVEIDVMDKTLIWLIGNDHPDAVITSPNGGEVVTAATVNIAWTETAHGSASIATRSLSYSPDAGSTWSVITNSPGASPYAWDVSGLSDGVQYVVRIAVTDDGSPSLRGSDASDAVFTLDRPGGDTQGPAVVAGSIQSDPNPMNNVNQVTLSATITDVYSGGSDIAEAEWSWGDIPAPGGSGHPMTGSFDAVTVDVSAQIPALSIEPGERNFWVRGRDSDGSWGNPALQVFIVNGQAATGVGDPRPTPFALLQNAPNPFRATTHISFSLAEAGAVTLEVYSVTGQLVRTLVRGFEDAGEKSLQWDGRDDMGRGVTGGIYFYRLHAPGFEATRKMVLME